MTKKPKLGHDPFNEEPLSFIRDTRREKPGKSSNISNTENTKIQTRARKKKGRPKGSGAKDRDTWKRATFIVKRAHLEKIKSLAYWERLTATEVLDRALEAYLKGKTIKAVRSK